MWSPTHVQVLISRAKGLIQKGKNGTNDAFVTIALGKEKFQTSVKEKTSDPTSWNEQCDLLIPSQGNTADIVLTVLHRNFLGVDEFLGRVDVPLRDFDVYERPRSRWYQLKCKSGQNKNDYRGEIEVKIGFTVKASSTFGGSATDLSKKNRGSIPSLQKLSGSVSGSLMSLGKKEKKGGIKKIVKSIGDSKSSKGNKTLESQLSVLEELNGNEDPGVNSDDSDDDGDVNFENNNYDDMIGFTRSSDPVPRKRTTERSSINSSKLFPLNENETSTFSQNNSQDSSNDVMDGNSQGVIKSSPSGLPSYNEATSGMFYQTPTRKKKIIPVQSDFESSSPSPEGRESPSPVSTPSRTIRTSQSSVNLAKINQDLQSDRTKKSLGMKLKTSYSSLLDLRKYGLGSKDLSPGFRDHSELVGRVTPKSELSTPTLQRSRLPHDVLVQYNGKTREDLIEMVIDLKKNVDNQGKKIVDLEDYIDNLLIKILDVAPILLKQDSPVISKHSI